MFRVFLFLFALLPFQLVGQTIEIDSILVEKFSTTDLTTVPTAKDLANRVSTFTADKAEQLQLLLLWVYKNMEADSVRFFHGGPRVEPAEAFKKRKGLCEDYSAIMDEFCQTLGIPHLRIEGYVRELDFQPKTVFKTGNHVWNAVFVGSNWVLCDLFWSTSSMKSSSDPVPGFERKLNTKYYLSPSANFSETHLPLDPVFQLTDHPIKLEAFTNVAIGIDEQIERMPYCNYLDSIRNIQKLPPEERELNKAKNAYLYNPQNSNVLIAAYYNHAVPVLNNRSAKKAELLRVKRNLIAAIELLKISDDSAIQSLTEQCKEGVAYADQRLKTL